MIRPFIPYGGVFNEVVFDKKICMKQTLMDITFYIHFFFLSLVKISEWFLKKHNGHNYVLLNSTILVIVFYHTKQII